VSRRVPLVLVGGLVVLAACSAPTTGSPAPVTPSSPSTGPSSSADPLAKVDPCSLLTPDQISGNKITSKKSQLLDGTRTCQFNRPTSSDDDGYTIGVGVYDHESYRNIYVGSDPSSAHSVDGRPGLLIPVPGGISSSCQLVFEVTATSAVRVVVVPARDDTNWACTLAGQVAEAVEENLPAGA
jgi:hypothetical protein